MVTRLEGTSEESLYCLRWRLRDLVGQFSLLLYSPSWYTIIAALRESDELLFSFSWLSFLFVMAALCVSAVGSSGSAVGSSGDPLSLPTTRSDTRR